MRRFTLFLIVVAAATAVFALFSLFTPTAQAEEVGGIIDTDTTWTLAGSPYIITDSVIIQPGVTLTVEAGVEVQAQLDMAVEVNGTLVGLGTTAQPITFTSYPGANTKGGDDWQGIHVTDTGLISVNHFSLYNSLGLIVTGASNNHVELTNTTLSNNRFPINIDANALHRLQMNNVQFTNNILNRIIIETNYTPSTNVLSANVTLRPQPGLEGYQISDRYISVTVPAGITLTLEAGTTFIIPEFGNYLLRVQGHLRANGTVTSPVTFTVLEPFMYLWDGILIGDFSNPESTGSAYLQGVVFNYAEYGLFVGNIGPDDNVHLQDSVFQRNLFGGGIYASSLHKVGFNNVTFVDNTYDQIVIISEPLAGNVTLAAQPGLDGYLFSHYKPLQIPNGYTLTLEAGISLLAESIASHDALLMVEGRLEAAGTAVAPVTFTSSEDSTPGQWQGIVVNGGEVSLNHAEVRYATTNLTVNSPTSTVTITNSRLISASVNSITVNDGLLNTACSVITGNGQHGVFVSASGNPSVTITTSEIRGNGVGITNSHSLPVDARFNYWGDPSGPGGIGPGSGDAVYGNVFYDPWLVEPTCSLPSLDLPIVSITDSTAVESDPFLAFTVTLNITSEQDVWVDYETMDGTAVAGQDYLPISGTLTIPSGQDTAVLTIPLINNNLDDGDRTFSLVLSNPVNAEIGNGTAVGLILDDDLPPEFSQTIFLPVVLKP